MFGKTRESLPCNAPTEHRYANNPPISETPPRHKNDAMRRILEKHELALTAERATVRGAVARFLHLKGTP